MQVYLLRHGIAEDGRPGQPDADRALTPEGKKKLRGVLKRAKEVGVQPDLILSSPYRRAVETAEIAAHQLDYSRTILRSDTLVPSGKPEAVWDELRIHKDEPQIMISGHDPLLSNLTAYLLHCPDLQVDFKKGAIIRIDLDRFSAAPRGILKWMLVSKLAH
ncbi:MAG: phosphohistidine phosphatase SixA [Acidobacteriaceae bacterium]|nr:phosphohistidine phosphatase SixA [Acidobacteriaceae bacterium]